MATGDGLTTQSIPDGETEGSESPHFQDRGSRGSHGSLGGVERKPRPTVLAVCLTVLDARRVDQILSQQSSLCVGRTVARDHIRVVDRPHRSRWQYGWRGLNPQTQRPLQTCARRDSNSHPEGLAFETSVYAYSTTGACRSISNPRRKRRCRMALRYHDDSWVPCIPNQSKGVTASYSVAPIC